MPRRYTRKDAVRADPITTVAVPVLRTTGEQTSKTAQKEVRVAHECTALLEEVRLVQFLQKLEGEAAAAAASWCCSMFQLSLITGECKFMI